MSAFNLKNQEHYTAHNEESDLKRTKPNDYTIDSQNATPNPYANSSNYNVAPGDNVSETSTASSLSPSVNMIIETEIPHISNQNLSELLTEIQDHSETS